MERIRFGMKNKKDKKKELKEWSLSRALVTYSMCLNIPLFILAIINTLVWRNVKLSYIITSVCIALMLMLLVINIVDAHNFKCLREKFAKEWLEQMDDAVRRGMEDAKKKDARITNDDK